MADTPELMTYEPAKRVRRPEESYTAWRRRLARLDRVSELRAKIKSPTEGAPECERSPDSD